MSSLIDPVSRQVADDRLRDLRHRLFDSVGAAGLLVVASAGVWALGSGRLAIVLSLGAVTGLLSRG